MTDRMPVAWLTAFLAVTAMAVLVASRAPIATREPPARDVWSPPTAELKTVLAERSTPGQGLLIHGASSSQRRRLQHALSHFSQAGLSLPSLQVRFYSEQSPCHGAKGSFNPNTEPWTISICTVEVGSVLEHELAHAWERANLTDSRRDAFLRLRDLDQWRGEETDWNDRGVEWAAVIIQQGLAGLPLSPHLSSETISRLQGFEILTGRPAPVLAEWIADRYVECDQRPTDLSRSIPDAGGRSCDDPGLTSLRR